MSEGQGKRRGQGQTQIKREVPSGATVGQRRSTQRFSLFRSLALASSLALAGHARAQPLIADDFTPWLTITSSLANTGMISQMAWGPDGRLYASRSAGGAVSFHYDAATGELSDMQAASDISGQGIGFVPARGEMYLGTVDSLWRLTDPNGDGHWGDSGETKVALVTNIPNGFHPVDQIQVQGNTLYIGVGIRTSDGGTNTWPFAPEGETACGGSICWIKDVSLVPSVTDAARLLGPLTVETIQTDGSPYTSTASDKLVVHSAGTRNPYGLAFDRNGQLFFTSNYNRAETHGDGTSNASGDLDAPGNDLTHAVHDQFFRAVENGDYGFRNDNWRGVRDASIVARILDLGASGHVTLRSITPDNLRSTDPNYLQLHDPAHPVGLGPSSSADGFAFWYHPALPPALYGCAFITRWNNQISESSPGTRSIVYSDLVAADPNSGTVSRVASGFVNPLAALADGQGHLLVADWGAGVVYTITAHAPIDSDSDGLPDYWLQQYFGHPTAQADDLSRPDDDADGDGVSNLREYLAGTNPRKATSVLRITALVRDENGLTLSFPSVTGKQYRLESSADLLADTWSILSDHIIGTGGIIQQRDAIGGTGAATVSDRFYRVRAMPLNQ